MLSVDPDSSRLDSRAYLMTQIISAGGDSPFGALRRIDLPASPSQLGCWKLLRPLGEGALSVVYEACPAEGPAAAAACYAVKVLKSRWDDRAEAVELFRREALVGHTVSHPHVIPVLDWGVDEPPLYVVMPRLVGRTLRERIDARGQLELPMTIWIARQAAQALGALYGCGFMHADVKPANLFLATDGHVTLLDLGYARARGETITAGARPELAAHRRALVGTINYMAPELFTSSLAADIRSDIYSLGVVMYEMLTGRLPYEGRNPAEIAALQRAGVPDRLRCLAPQLPTSIVSLIRSMLAKEPLRRPQTPDELVDRLVRLEMTTLPERVPA